MHMLVHLHFIIAYRMKMDEHSHTAGSHDPTLSFDYSGRVLLNIR